MTQHDPIKPVASPEEAAAAIQEIHQHLADLEQVATQARAAFLQVVHERDAALMELRTLKARMHVADGIAGKINPVRDDGIQTQ